MDKLLLNINTIDHLVTGCGGMIMADEGIVTSPGYPNRYNHNTECEWVITTSPGTKVVVFMDDKNIPES